MTREKAIEIIEYHKTFVDNDKSGLLDKDLEYEAINKAIKALEQEQEPRKGHWKLVQRGKSIDICCSKCGAVRIKEYAYNYTIDQLDKEDIMKCLESDDMRYCPYCGSDNREVEE